MTKKSMKIVALVVCVLMGMMLFSACSQGTTETATDETATTTEAATTANTAEAATSAGKQWDYSSLERFSDDETIIGEENIFYTDLQNTLWGTEVLVPDKELTIGFVPKAMENEFWRMVDEGIQEEVEKMNAAGFNVTVDTRTGQGETDYEGQLSVMLDMVNQGYDAIIIGPISDANLVPGVERAQEAGIPVIPIWVFFREDPLVDVYMGPSSYQEGQLAAEYFAEQIGSEGGQVAVITGIPSNVITGARTSGFSDYFTNNPDLGIEVVDTQNGDWDRMTAKDIADTMVKTYPDLKGIYCNNDTMALGAVEAVRAAGKMDEILVGGTDAVSEALTSIENGELDYTTNNFPTYMGKISLEMAIRTLSGENLPENIIGPLAGMNSSNVTTSPAELAGWKDIEWVSAYSE